MFVMLTPLNGVFSLGNTMLILLKAQNNIQVRPLASVVKIMDDDFIRLKETQNERVYQSYHVSQFLRRNENVEQKNIKFIEHLNDEMHCFLEFLQPSKEERILRKFMVEKIKETILSDLQKMRRPLEEGTTDHPIAKTKGAQNEINNSVKDSIHCFGSYETDLYLPGSDIDMTIFTDQEDALRGLQYSLADNPLIFSKSIIFLSKAKIPILRFMDICHFRYDLCLNQDTGIIQAKFIKKIIQEKPFIRNIVLFLKYFLKTRELNESRRGGLCSYAQLLMICNFVTLHPMIQCGIKLKTNLAVILLDFFQYFGQDFSYSTAQLCHDRYKMKDSNNYLSIEDPTNIGHDVGSLSTNMGAIKDVFFHAYKIMLSVSRERYGNRYAILPLWVKIGDFELKWRENVAEFYEKVVIKNEI